MRLTDHAKAKAARYGLTEEEVRRCVHDGEIVMRYRVGGQLRTMKEISMGPMRLVVIQTVDRTGEEVVITCYLRKR